MKKIVGYVGYVVGMAFSVVGHGIYYLGCGLEKITDVFFEKRC